MRTVLVVDDDAAMRQTLARQLAGLGYHAALVASVDAAIEHLALEAVDVVLTDVRMPGRDGLDLCRLVLAEHPDVPVVVMTGYGTVDAAIEAIRVGAWDFLRKPFELEELEVALQRAVSHRRLRAEVRDLRRVAAGPEGPAGLLGQSPAMRDLFSRIERVAATTATVLVRGESGTGKERVARALHEGSARAHKPLVAVNCAAIPESLLESELFGHAPGAYTGAVEARQGLFRAAHGGTLFLDEVGELSMPAQARLLRALEERVVRPVGADREVRVDVRFVAATHLDLDQAVREGRFREDLFYRLRVVTLTVPPLRERGDDVLLLASRFLDELAEASGRALAWDDAFEDALLAWRWPGNVRELRNVLEAAAALSADGVLGADALPPELRQGLPSPAAHRARAPTPAPSREPDLGLAPLAEVERRHILRVLDAVGGNRSRAARILGIDRKTLHARLRRYEDEG